MKSGWKKKIIAGAGIAGTYLVARRFAEEMKEDVFIEAENPYLASDAPEERKVGIYEGKVKHVLDQVLSFGGLAVLSPLFAIISLAIVIDDPGPVFFTQKRIGRDKHYMHIHKFRSMRLDAPHDVPTHQLENPDQYITKVGRFLRRTSLDELPQIWDIFCGRMSVIGPRPALWNQNDLVKERDKYNANSVMPGLTGLAQIKGRDELLIPDKAALDGVYAAILRKGGIKAFYLDIKCFIGTLSSVLKHDGIVEGGTGAVRKIEIPAAEEAGFADYGHLKHFSSINKGVHKKVLITGAGSYIGESFKDYCKKRYPNIEIAVIDMEDSSWREKNFQFYDTVFHVAGIAHADIGKTECAGQKAYYAVNTDLSIECCRKAKGDGVRQFIFMSSILIYGGQKYIDEHAVPSPSNFYGNSKWLADKGVRALSTQDFKVCVLRPPMIYGRGCKGNYLQLSKLAKKLPYFPDVKNKRSMLYIENLCEFVALMVLSGEGGIYFPQNRTYSKTSYMVKLIGNTAGKKVVETKAGSLSVNIAMKIPGKIGRMAEKAFGSSVYDKSISGYAGLDYQLFSLEESIKRTEGTDTALNHKKPILILVNHEVVIYNFRLELVERLLSDGYEVHISTPPGERIEKLRSIGAICHDIEINRHGMNPLEEAGIFREYIRLMKNIKPIIVLGFTIKPNIYGALAARTARVPFIANITGLGTAVETNRAKQRLIVLLYKAAFGSVQCIFFQNEENQQFFKKQGILLNKYALLPGSGVNLERYSITHLPPCGDGKSGEAVKFAFISRIMKEKGIDQYLSAAEKIKNKYPSVEFHVCGFCETEYHGRLEELRKTGLIHYHGMIEDVAGFMSRMHCIVHPTYYPEGLSNVLLEASACGRPVITCNRSGCREAVQHNGFLVPEKSTKELVKAMEKFLALSYEQKAEMGILGRKMVEEKFDRQIVVNAYIDEINCALNLRGYHYE